MKPRILTATIALLASGTTFAQATIKEDGQWRAALTVSAATTSGNTKSSSLSLLGDGVRATPQDKWALYANTLYQRAGGVTTADQGRLGVKYDWTLTPAWYLFGLAEAERDEIARLNSRLTLGSGAGWRLLRTDSDRIELFAGLGYVSDRYDGLRLVDNALRDSYSYATLLLGEETSHKFGATTSFKQRMVIYPNLKNSGDYRAQFDAGVSVAMTQTMALTAGFTARYNSDPGVGIRKTDTLTTVGVTVKFE